VSDLVHPYPHENRDGDGGADDEDAPEALKECIKNSDRETSQGEDENKEEGKRCDDADGLADLTLGDPGKALSLVTRRGEKHDHVVNAAAQDTTDNDPEGAGQETELRCQDGTEQRPRGGDRGKVVPEQNKLVGFHIVDAIRTGIGRGGTISPQGQHLVRDEQAVEPVGDRKYAQ
jgi:hypothetical protein